MPARVQIGAEAWRVMVREFRGNKPARLVAAIVERETGERVKVRTVERRGAQWRAEEQRRKAAREQMEDYVAAMRANDATAAEMVQALAMDALILHPERFQDADPVKMAGTALYGREVGLKERKLALQERQVAVIEKKLAILEEREKRSVAALSPEGAQLTDEERVKAIREIYGLQ